MKYVEMELGRVFFLKLETGEVVNDAIERFCAEHIGGLALPRFGADLPGARRKTPLDLL